MSDDAIRLAAIKKAYASGVLNIRHGDTSTTFRSLAEMERIIHSLEQATATRKRKPRYIMQRSKDSSSGGTL